jgi:hypothetical protein
MLITATLDSQFIGAPLPRFDGILFAANYRACPRARKPTMPQRIVGLMPTSNRRAHSERAESTRCDAFPGRSGGIPLFFAA